MRASLLGRVSAVVATGIMTLAFAMPSAAVTFGTNLIQNGDAEAGAGATDASTTVAVPSWTTSSNFTAVQYGVSGFPSLASPGPSDRGLNFFAGGPNTALSSASQSIDVSGSLEIASGSVEFALSGFLGGFDTQNDNAVLGARFMDVVFGVIATAVIGPVTASDRGNTTGLLSRSTSGFVPAETDRIDLVLLMTRISGSYDDGYADNLSLVLRDPTTSVVPEPATLLLLGGVAPFAVAAWRRRRS